MTRPSRYPLVATSPGGNYAEPGSGVILGGWLNGSIYPSSDANWLWRQITDWNRDHDATRLGSVDVLTATACRVSVSPLDLDLDGLTSVFTSGAVYYGNGERIDLTEAVSVYSGANALVFRSSATNYVHARPQPGAAGPVVGTSCAELLSSTSAVEAGYVALLEVVTNATDIISVAEVPGVSTYLEWGVTPNFTAGLIGTTASFSGQVTLDAGLVGTTASFSGQVTLDAGLWLGLSPRAVVREHTLNVMTMSVAAAASVASSDLSATVLGDSFALPNIITAVTASVQSFVMALDRPLHGNTLTSVEVDTKFIVVNSTNMTLTNYAVIRWRIDSGLASAEALHAGYILDTHNSGNFTTLVTQTLTLTQNNLIDLSEWRYGLRVRVPSGAVTGDAQLRIYSVRCVYAAAATLQHA